MVMRHQSSARHLGPLQRVLLQEAMSLPWTWTVQMQGLRWDKSFQMAVWTQSRALWCLKGTTTCLTGGAGQPGAWDPRCQARKLLL